MTLVGESFDVLVVGSGPAGSSAALVLARGGARVALVDKAAHPRDKACGDLIGPRGVRALHELGIEVRGAEPVGDMVVVGPTRRRVRLPCYEGNSYPGHGLAVPRSRFDALVHDAAVSAGAVAIVGRAGDPLVAANGAIQGFSLSNGREIRADVIIGADGATSRVAAAAGLVDAKRALWGFAVRSYVECPVSVPHIVLWEQSRWRGFPGYGWLFPGVDGRANVGVGVGTLGDRSTGSRAVGAFGAFVDELIELGLLSRSIDGAPRLGGWIKMGMVGTTPARGRVLLVGDAAGLVNPLQGEGISQALCSGRAAGEAVLAGVEGADTRYATFLAQTYAPFHSMTVPVQKALLARPWATSATGRVLTAPLIAPLIAGGWSIFWNDLLEGARPGKARNLAAAVSGLGRGATALGDARRRRPLRRRRRWHRA